MFDRLAEFRLNFLTLLLSQVLGELMGDKSLEKFRVEYEKLHRALKKSHESEKRLMQKCRELNAEIVANAAKVQTALKLSQEDQTTIASLKKVGKMYLYTPLFSGYQCCRLHRAILYPEVTNFSTFHDVRTFCPVGNRESLENG